MYAAVRRSGAFRAECCLLLPSSPVIAGSRLRAIADARWQAVLVRQGPMPVRVLYCGLTHLWRV
jgi:hypothetical protein